MGPSPQGRRRRPWDPLGPFWCPWVPLAPLGPLPPLGLWVLGSLGGLGWGWGPWGAFGSKGSAPCRSEKRTSRTLGGGADSAGENILGRRHARKRIWIHFSSNLDNFEKSWEGLVDGRVGTDPALQPTLLSLDWRILPLGGVA